MRLGLIVRGDLRGLGIQTHEIWRHLRPAVTVGVDISPIDPRGQWPQHWERYDTDMLITPWAGYLNPISAQAKEALLSCEVILTVETPYDPDLFSEARAKGIKTVIYVNPELHRTHETEQAAEVWYPTDWMIDQLPPGEVVSMPVALERFSDVAKGDGWLHVGGHQARGDRDGTMLALRGARGAGIRLTVTSQDRMRTAPQFDYRAPTDDYWQLYEGMGFLVIPRRYGGLSLKVQEALANQMVVVMPGVPPNSRWPIVPVKATNGQMVNLPGGRVRMAHPDLNHLVSVLRGLRDADPEVIEGHRQRSRAWATENSWETLGPLWQELLAR